MRILSLITGLLPNFFKGIAEGQFGEVAKKVYWALAGKKTLTALIMVILYGVANVALNVFGQCVPECATQAAVDQWAVMLTYVPEIVSVAIAIGLYDSAIRLEPPTERKG